MPELSTIIGYLSGILLIDPEIEASSLVPTLVAIHLFDGILCFLIALHSRRNARVWGVIGLTAGVWAVVPLLLLPDRTERQNDLGTQGPKDLQSTKPYN